MSARAATLALLAAVTLPTQATPDHARAAEAARRAASGDPACTNARMGDFYWEIGDASQALASGSQGRGSIDASTRLAIASATKFVFGAYVLQKKGIDAVRADPSLRTGLNFTSGYTSFKQLRCLGQRTVGGCYAAGFGRGEVAPDANTAGRFYYQGGHDQKLAAVDLGLAPMDADELMREIRGTLHLPDGLTMAGRDLLLAGGMQGSASDYARFLRSVLKRELVIGAHLGENAVCAQPAVCPAGAESSPIEGLGEPWSYSYNHWVESEKGQGSVDAYSSPGAFGFYPWISADQHYYGVLSRHERARKRPAIDSVLCGRAIRKAFLDAL